ncbi:MAG: MBL fold metallo-hydrolase [Chloroflexi bacterium]|nr:MBL fold metallo-hydrolase [Chloroflexota bacterium]
MTIMVEDETLRIDRLQLGSFGTNAYILACRKTGASVLVDAPGEAGEILENLKGTNPKYILLTHSHWDHTGALTQLRSGLGIPLAAHAADAGKLSAAPEIRLDGGDTVTFGNIRLEVMHTPGHTPGSLCFKTGDYLISGDTIFPGGPGKTDTPAAFERIIESITNQILILDDSTRIFPGHGDATVLKKEREAFAVFSSKKHPPGLHGDVTWLSSG